jgi:hypothetical protein
MNKEFTLNYAIKVNYVPSVEDIVFDIKEEAEYPVSITTEFGFDRESLKQMAYEALIEEIVSRLIEDLNLELIECVNGN